MRRNDGRAMQALAVGVGLCAVIVLGLWMHSGSAPSPPSHAPAAPEPQQARSDRVEDRLRVLREQWVSRATATSTATAPPVVHDVPRGASSPLPGPGVRQWPRKAAKPAPDAAAAAADLHEPNGRPRVRYLPPQWMDPNADLGSLESTILDNPDPEAQVRAVQQLSGEEPEDALRVLTSVLGMPDKDPRVRAAALEALGDFPEDVPPAFVDPFLTDSDPQVRFEAVSLLADMEQQEALDAIRRVSNDPDPDVRDLARGVLDLRD
jgi:hypothetical protein